MQYKKILSGTIAVAAFSIASIALALSPNDYSLFGDAQYISPGNASARAVQLDSVGFATYGGIDYGVGSAPLTVADVNNLATDYRLDVGSCGGGSPRFQINVQTPTNGIQNIFVYIGPPPSYTGCPTGVWTNTGNLVTPVSLVDASQLGGTFYQPWASVQALYGTYPVVGFQVVDDGGWSQTGNEQKVSIDNTQINSTTYTYEVPVATSKDQCKNGGWQNFNDNNGHGFKNQGDCVSFVASGGKNQGSK